MIWFLAVGLGASLVGIVWVAYHYGKYVGQHDERRRVSCARSVVRHVRRVGR